MALFVFPKICSGEEKIKDKAGQTDKFVSSVIK